MVLGMVFWAYGLGALILILAHFFGVWAFPAMLAFVPYFWMAYRMDASAREEIERR